MVSDPQTYPAFEAGYDAESTAKSSKSRTLYTSGENWTDVVVNVVFEEGFYIIIDADDALNRPTALPVPGQTENQYNCSLIGNDSTNIINRTLKMHLVGTERNFTWDLDNGTLTEDASGSGAVTADSVSNAISQYTQSTPEAIKELVLANKQLLLISELQEFFAGAFAPIGHDHDDRYDGLGTAAGLVASEASTRSNADNAISQALTDLTTIVNQISNWKTSLTDADTDSIVNTLTELLASVSSLPEGTDLYTLINSKLSGSDVVNSLTSVLTNVPLSAAQGTALKGLIDGLTTALSAKEDSSNKTGDIASNSASTTKFPHAKGVFDYVTGGFRPISYKGAFDEEYVTVPAGVSSLTLKNSTVTAVSNVLDSTITGLTVSLPTPVAGAFNQSVLYFEIGSTLPTGVSLSAGGVIFGTITLTSNTKWKLVYDQVRTGASTYVKTVNFSKV